MKKIYGKNKLSNSDRWIENAEKRQISALLLYKMAAKDRQGSCFALCIASRNGFLSRFEKSFRVRSTAHGGIAFGFDRMCSMFGGIETIRDFIAFPKNNKARDLMAESPSEISSAQLEELYISLIPKEK